MSDPRRILLVATVLAGMAVAPLAQAEGTVSDYPVPPVPTPGQISADEPATANPINSPITGALQLDKIVGGETPPSLEALQDMRPGDEKGDGLKPGREDQLRSAAHVFGAQGGLAARSFAINEMLRRYEPQLDSTYDFHALVLPVGGGQTLMRPPIVSQAQMAFALGDNGQVARETACVYEITREAQLTSAPPNWRTYLVRVWSNPQRPADASLPRTDKEVQYWNKWVAEGWADGERQAVDIFQSDLGRLQRDITGMARYRVLLRAGRVEEPRVVFQTRVATGGGDTLHLNDRTIRITGQPGLQASPRSYGYPEDCR
ncbi:MAG: type IV secretion system DotC family protein [Janthinobacterium lividum]